MKRLGVTVIETAGNPPKPFRLWRADVLACPICGAELVTRFAHAPMLENYEDGFEAALDEANGKKRRYVVHGPEALAMVVTHRTVESYQSAD